MLTETTITKLREMRLSVMANALKDQLEDSQYNSMAFEDRLGLIVDAEWNARKSNHLQRLIRQATFSDPAACLENVGVSARQEAEEGRTAPPRDLQLHP